MFVCVCVENAFKYTSLEERRLEKTLMCYNMAYVGICSRFAGAWRCVHTVGGLINRQSQASTFKSSRFVNYRLGKKY